MKVLFSLRFTGLRTPIILKGLKQLARALVESGERIIFPMHPHTRKRIMEYGFEWFTKAGNIEVTEPMGYLEFLDAMSRARTVSARDE
ncbi:MAG: UDP-N-acetylglucosamine 2-epimerase [Thermoproteota archaeon]|nr:UDP-N-acetylglucosamine 2-epimerase [Candidatus Brockarchaeota archaeon]